MNNDQENNGIPLDEKYLLTLKEAAVYTNICESKLREMAKDKTCAFVLKNGAKFLIKRKKLEEFLEEKYAI